MNTAAAGRTAASPSVSVVIPVFNEADNVGRVHDAVTSVLNTTGLDYEIIFVDDGSDDETAQVLRRLVADDRRVRFARFRRNFGQTPAMAAGIQLASGSILITMDGDLQNDPRDIPAMVARVVDGADIVAGWRARRQDHYLTRVLPSRIANWLIGRVTGVPIRDNGCSLKAYRASVIKRVPLYSDMHRFIPAMASITGARVEQMRVRHHARRFGTSKYGLGRVWRVLFDMISVKMVIAFASRPALWFTLIAVGPLLLAAGAGLFGLAAYADDPASASFVPLGITLLSGALASFLLGCGVLGELVFRSSESREHHLSKLTAIVSESGDRIRPAPAVRR